MLALVSLEIPWSSKRLSNSEIETFERENTQYEIEGDNFSSGNKSLSTDCSLVHVNTEKQLDSEIASVLSSVKQLLSRYKMCNKTNEAPTTGGLQHFIINKLKKKQDGEKSWTQRLRALYLREESVEFSFGSLDGEDVSMIDQLPVDMKLHIFSFLDAKSLCRASGVSRDWSELLEDNLLWKRRLLTDQLTWSQVSHVTDPQQYLQAESDMPFKQIYLRTCPDVLREQREETSTFHQVSSALKSLLPRKAPRIAMFGPGLESSTSAIVRKMLYEDQAMFSRVAMFPGQFDGFGAGMTLQLPNGSSFHLSVLYTASRQERENGATGQQARMSRNRMLNAQPASRDGEEAASYELLPALQQLCQTLHAFIFVVDASGSRESVCSARTELRTMVQERWASPQVPVLVLSCVPTATSPRLPAVEVVRALQLSDFAWPWMVMDCVSEDLHNVDKAIQWIMGMCQRR